jgi:hypothetical protein
MISVIGDNQIVRKGIVMIIKNLLTYSLIPLMILTLSGCESDEDKSSKQEIQELKEEVKTLNNQLADKNNAELEKERRRKARYEKLQKQAEQYRIQLEETK